MKSKKLQATIVKADRENNGKQERSLLAINIRIAEKTSQRVLTNSDDEGVVPTP